MPDPRVFFDFSTKIAVFDPLRSQGTTRLSQRSSNLACNTERFSHSKRQLSRTNMPCQRGFRWCLLRVPLKFMGHTGIHVLGKLHFGGLTSTGNFQRSNLNPAMWRVGSSALKAIRAMPCTEKDQYKQFRSLRIRPLDSSPRILQTWSV